VGLRVFSVVPACSELVHYSDRSQDHIPHSHLSFPPFLDPKTLRTTQFSRDTCPNNICPMFLHLCCPSSRSGNLSLALLNCSYTIGIGVSTIDFPFRFTQSLLLLIQDWLHSPHLVLGSDCFWILWLVLPFLLIRNVHCFLRRKYLWCPCLYFPSTPSVLKTPVSVSCFLFSYLIFLNPQNDAVL